MTKDRMPNTKVLNSAPKSVVPEKKEDLIDLLIHGQGVFLFSSQSDCKFFFYNSDKSDGLEVALTESDFTVRRIKNSDRFQPSQPLPPDCLTHQAKSGAYYWFSLDSQNQRLQAGLGEPRTETSFYSYQFDKSDKLWEANKIFFESLISIQIDENIVPIRLLKNPITRSIPLCVKGINELTMDDVASNSYLPSAGLSAAAQALYNCVAGKNFILDTSDFPDFSKAIEYSINTKGLWCNERLKQKANEFSKDAQPKETYLRITLGENNGESPGVPYVMEIWPSGHYSPIHNHGGANAVIRVLHGKIEVSLFPFLCDDAKTVPPFAVTSFVKDDITWISSTLNQVHQLKNTGKEACITIQCYLYDKSDKDHYDYFDYLGNQNAKSQYEPDSDMDFVEFKKKMIEEWNSKNKKVKKSKLLSFM